MTATKPQVGTVPTRVEANPDNSLVVYVPANGTSELAAVGIATAHMASLGVMAVMDANTSRVIEDHDGKRVLCYAVRGRIFD